jgi:autotransporter adhesin
LSGAAHDSVARTAAASAQATADSAHTRIDGNDATLANHESRITALEAFPAGTLDQVARDGVTAANARIDHLDDKATSGIAAAMATAAALPAGVDLMPGEASMNIGVGAYENRGALAMGWAHRIKSSDPLVSNAIVRGAIAITGGRTALSAGIGWKW